MKKEQKNESEIKIFRGKRYDGFVEGQLLVIDKTPCIVPVENRLPSLPFDKCLVFDGHHITQDANTPLWVKSESVEFVREEEIEIE